MNFIRSMITGCFFTALAFLVLVMSGCKSFKEQEDALPDNSRKGTIHVSADETFKPVIDEQVKVYEANHPGTRIIVHFKPEAECLKDFLVDSFRMIITTHRFSDEEKEFVVDSLGLSPKTMTVARDAIAVIVNKQAPDSLFTMAEIREILTGKFKKNL